MRREVPSLAVTVIAGPLPLGGFPDLNIPMVAVELTTS
jgi:hypothetical protein